MVKLTYRGRKGGLTRTETDPAGEFLLGPAPAKALRLTSRRPKPGAVITAKEGKWRVCKMSTRYDSRRRVVSESFTLKAV